MKIVPGHVSVVPEEVCFVLELRSIDDAAVKKACAEVSAMAKRVYPCTASVEQLGAKPAVPLDERLVKKIKDSADKAGLSAVVMPSGASHDSSPIAHVIPTGMIFVPSHDGVSHSKDEFTTNDDVLHGVELLKEAVLAIDRDL
ncbi:M20/M25/M40 family metallo-hydrolase [Cloacibacillus sp.]|uniref:M20/M25/M40 family metallo-hydrolase n=1 Tax=Cloacibacillus sp. TaxID=2049023 RepID=UPI0025C2D144|nr:M20/M25/M40 family metallo-hydrolase [Cloacibacillus sp.]MCC8058974.1 M20/M25/M40 family metallo-hydrolase [Cloacibacillus sp.]